MEGVDGFYSDKPRQSYGMGDQVHRGRRSGQQAPRAAGSDPGGRPSNDGGTPATAPTSASQQAPAPVPDGPLAIQPPANDLSMLLHRYGKRPSMKRPNGPIPDLIAGQLEFNPFENRWIE